MQAAPRVRPRRCAVPPGDLKTASEAEGAKQRSSGAAEQAPLYNGQLASADVNRYLASNAVGTGNSTGTPFASQVPAVHRRWRSFGVACTIR
jgi:hypothetical protein